MDQLITVNLTKNVTYMRGATEVTIPKDTLIEFDLQHEFGIWNGEAFDLFRDEYCLTN